MTEAVGNESATREKVGVESGGAKCGEQPRPIGEHEDQHEAEPVSGNCEQRHGCDGQERVGSRSAACRLHHTDGEAQQIAQEQRQRDQPHRRGPRGAEDGAHGTPLRDARSPVATGESRHPARELGRQRSIEIEGPALGSQLLGRCGWAQHQPDRIARRDVQQQERQNHDAEHDGDTGEETVSEPGQHRRESRAASDGPLE